MGFYAAGYLEGYLTAESICDFSANIIANQFQGNETLERSAITFLRTNANWVKSNTQVNNTQYWEQARTWLYGWHCECVHL